MGYIKLCTPNGVQMGYKWGTKWGTKWSTQWGTKEGSEVNLLVKDGHTGFLCTPKWGT